MRKEGLFYPLIPLSGAISTIGGNIATNSVGPSALKYGPTGNYVESLEVVTPGGEVLVCPCQNGGFSSGFPLASLFCGSQGCLSVIVKARLRLLPITAPPQNYTFTFVSEDAAVRAAQILLQSKLNLESLEYCDAQDVFKDKRPRLVITYERQASAVIAEIMQSVGGRIAEAPEWEQFWSALKKFPSLSFSCPFTAIGAGLSAIRSICKEYSRACTVFGQIAISRLFVVFDDSPRDEIFATICQEIFALQLMLNDRLTHEADADLSRRQWSRAQALVALSENLRAMLDPARILSAQPSPGISDL